MTKKDFFVRFAGFIAIAVAALPVYALTVNALVFFKMIPAELTDKSFGSELTFRAVIVWCGCLLLGFAGIFPREGWRYILYFSPLYAPALYAIFHTLMQ